MPLRILAVDDEPDITRLLRHHLERCGHEVRVAANGWEALAEIKLQRPDLVLLDLMLPDLDGFGVCEILRRDEVTALIPIVIVSAWSSTESRRLGFEFGALDYIIKPFDPHALVERVNRFAVHVRAEGQISSPAAG